MAQAEQSRAALRARARLGSVIRGKYRLDAVLGVGGMAIVYKATHRNQAEVAIKMLLPEVSVDEDLRKRFLQEGYAANSVKHAGVVTIIDEDVAEDGAAYLVMELLDGLSTDELAERCHNVPPRIASAVGIQVLDVLAAAHVHGVLHRDVKPGNVFITRDGMVKVLDFGIARVRDLATSSARLTATGATIGTPAFMSPEQARGRLKEVREQTDVFAAGATLFTLISGKLVHEGESSAETMIKTATEQARSILSVAPEVPLGIARVIDRALAFRADERWGSAGEMRDALLGAHRDAFGDDPSATELASFSASFIPLPDAAVSQPTRRLGSAPMEATVGGTTVRFATEARVRTRRSVVLAAVGVIVVMGITSAVLAVARYRTAHVPSPVPVVISAEPSASIPIASATATPRASAAPTASSTTVATTRSRPIVRTAPSKPNCNPKYVLDADGQKHFKPECF